MSDRIYEYVVDAASEGMRLDAYLGKLDEIASRSAAARLIEDSFVTVDGECVAKKYVLSAGETIVIEVPARPLSDLVPEYIPLDIRYEDSDFIVLSKQPGLVVHPAHGNWSGTLVNALLAHSLSLGSLQGEDRPGIVHRLDKDTSGLMMAAKTDDAQVRLQDDIRLRVTDRRYLALVHGWIAPNTGLIDAPIGRDVKDRLRMAVGEGPGTKGAVTTFTVLERFEAGRFDEGYTLVECKLYTGRTHQIRVHMEYIHHCLVGDQTYGKGSVKANHHLDRQFLHSYSLRVNHPRTGEMLSFIDPLPDDLQRVLDEIEEYSAGRTDEGKRVLDLLIQEKENRKDSSCQ